MANRLRLYALLMVIIGLVTFPGCGGANLSSGPPPPSPMHNEWTWVGGSNTVNQPGVYGTQGVRSPSNTPGGRASPCSWTDSSGNLWLFGGYATELEVGDGDRNDLWKFTPATGEWTWVGGSNTFEQPGTYGTRGTPAPGNVPGGRYESACWTDPFGNFWLFGGLGLDSTGTRGDLNDLWKYSPATAMWTWMGGPSTLCTSEGNSACPAVYGTQGVPALANTSGGRVDAVGWTDASGNLWLFGGLGLGWGATGGPGVGILNDLWKYDPATNMWTWMSGPNTINQYGVYGTMGTPAPANVPGARAGALAWSDQAGNLWLFGGEGNDSNGKLCVENGGALACDLNDLWKYTPATNIWTWMGGSNVIAQTGVYGTQGEAASGNFPGARWLAAGWTDAVGEFWLFGGSGFDSLGTRQGNADLNDLWKYSGGQWTWVSGSDIADQAGTYGTLGTASPDNSPGAREWAAGWIDGSGNLWLFGGFFEWGLPNGKYNDLWKYAP